MSVDLEVEGDVLALGVALLHEQLHRHGSGVERTQSCVELRPVIDELVEVGLVQVAVHGETVGHSGRMLVRHHFSFEAVGRKPVL